MLSLEKQIICAIRHLRQALNLQTAEFDMPILECRREAGGAALIGVGLSNAVYAWVRVQPDGTAERVSIGRPPHNRTAT